MRHTDYTIESLCIVFYGFKPLEAGIILFFGHSGNSGWRCRVMVFRKYFCQSLYMAIFPTPTHTLPEQFYPFAFWCDCRVDGHRAWLNSHRIQCPATSICMCTEQRICITKRTCLCYGYYLLFLHRNRTFFLFLFSVTIHHRAARLSFRKLGLVRSKSSKTNFN